MTIERKAVEARIAELREDDAAMSDGPWVTDDPDDPEVVADDELRKTVVTLYGRVQKAANGRGIARTRNSLASTADMLEGLLAASTDDALEAAETYRAATAEIARLTAENERLRLSAESKDAVIAAGARTIESSNEARRTLREQWHADRDKLRAEVAATRPVVEAAERRVDWDRGHPSPGDRPYAGSIELESAVDAYRDSKVPT